MVGDLGDVRLLGDEPPDETVGVLDRSFFPAVIRAAKEGLRS